MKELQRNGDPNVSKSNNTHAEGEKTKPKRKKKSERSQIDVALKIIRKAHVQRNSIEIEKAKAFENSIGRYSHIPYSELGPIHMKDIKVLQKEARAQYALTVEKSKTSAQSDKLGVPRTMFSNLIADIMNEEKQKARSSRHAKKIKAVTVAPVPPKVQILSLDDENGDIENIELIDMPTTDSSFVNRIRSLPETSVDSAGSLSNEDSEKKSFKRKHNISRTVSQDSVFYDSQGSDSDKSDNEDPSPLRPRTAPNNSITPIRIASTPNSQMSSGFFSPNGRSISSSTGMDTPTRRSSFFSKSILESDDKIKAVIANRSKLLSEKEDAIVQKIEQREQLYQYKLEQETRWERQRRWLLILNVASRFWVFQKAISDRRNEVMSKASASRAKKAARVIEKWWFYKSIDLRFNRNPKKNVLRAALVRMWYRYTTWKRKKSIVLIKIFLRDSTGISDCMKKVYAFRGKAIRVQKYFRSWWKVQEARLEYLYLALDRSEKKRIERAKNEKIRKEREALLAVGRMNGFADTLIGINKIQTKMDRVFEAEERLMKHAAYNQKKYEAQILRLENIDLPANISSSPYSSFIHSTDSNHAANTSHQSSLLPSVTPKRNQTMKTSRNSILSSRSVGGGERRRIRASWYTKMMSNPVNRKVIEVLRDVLAKQRKRHYLGYDDHNEAAVYRPAGDIKVNISGIRHFLKDPNSLEGINDTMEIVDLPDKVRRAKFTKEKSRLFLLMTKGAASALDELPLLINK